MILAFHIGDIITVPFGYLLDWMYRLSGNYGMAMLLFAILVKIILIPITAKSKKTSMKLSRLSPRIKEIQDKYTDQQKQGEALQALYKEEGVSMGGGCLWSLVPLLILFPLLAVVRQPLVYMLHETAETAQRIVAVMTEQAPQYFTGNTYYAQVAAARHIHEYAQVIRDAIPGVSEATLAGMNFDFLGIDVGAIPEFNVFAWSAYDWAHIGAFLIPVFSAGSQVLSMFIMTKMNNSVITDKNGVKDKETAENSQANQTNKTMMIISPLLSLWVGFTVPGALSLYWFVQGVVSIVIDVVLTQHYRKIYDAEDAIRLQQAMERDRIEAEKERQRAERRAANPEGITENTSKKKLQQKQQRDQQAAKAAAAKEYAARKGTVEEDEEADASGALSGVPSRPYCKGRAYDPNRYGNHTEE